MIPHDGPACPTPLEEEEEPPWDDASSGIVSSSIVKKTPLATCPVHKVGISRFSSKTGVYFLVRKSGFQLYLANSY